MTDILDINPSEIELPDPQLGLTALRTAPASLTTAQLEALSSIWGDALAELKAIWKTLSTAIKADLLAQMAALSLENLHLSYEEIAIFSLKTENGIGRKHAIDILVTNEDSRCIRGLVAALNNDSHPHTRSAAATKLFTFLELVEDGRLSDAHLDLIETSLVEACNTDESEDVRSAAVASLGPISSTEVEELIRENAVSRTVSLQAAAVLAMGRSYDFERWQDYVEESFEHTSPLVRKNAAIAAGMFAEDALLEELSELLFDDEVDVLESTIWAVGEIGGTTARRKLLEFQAVHEDEDYFDDMIEDALAMIDLGNGSGDVFQL